MKTKDQQPLEEAYKKGCENMMLPQSGGEIPKKGFDQKVIDFLVNKVEGDAAELYDVLADDEESIEYYETAVNAVKGKGGPSNPEWWIALAKYARHNGLRDVDEVKYHTYMKEL